MRRLVLLVLVVLAACGGKKGSSGKEVRIAAAADLARAFEEIGPAFEKATGIKAIVTPGSTGLLAKQIAEKAPFDLFAAANVSYVDEVVAAGACDASTQTLYARGRLVVWAKGDGAPKTLAELADRRFKKIGIANPDHAPYGKAAKQALEQAGIWDQVKDRVTFGENVQVPMQWAKTGDVDAAIVALSLAVVADGGSSIPVDPELHDPIDQALVVCGTGPGAEAAKQFAAFVGSPDGREIMTRYGFLLPGEAAPAGKGGTGGDRDGSGTGSAAAVPPESHIYDEDVEKLIGAWIDAQNADDLAKYETFYAERFGGVKRVGGRTWKFDRKGWLADRARMFKAKAPMVVEADDIAVTPVGSAMAVTRFTQTYAQAKFKDRGTKQLVVIKTKDGLRIASEQMLSSAMVDPRDDAPDAMMIVRDTAGAWLLLADAADVETKGKPTRGGGGEGFDYSTHTALATGHPLAGKVVTLYPSGTSCTLTEISVMNLLTPHFGTVQMWDGDEDGDGTPEGKPLSAAAIDREVADAGAAYVAANVSACAGAGQDVLGTFKPAIAWTSSTVPTAGAEAAFARLPEFKDIQTDFEQSYDGKGAWTESEDASGPHATAWDGPSGETILIVSARAGYGCGQFEASLHAVYELKNNTLTLRGLADGEPTYVIDLDGDGTPELVDATNVYTWDGTSFSASTTVDLGYADCPC